MGIYPPYQKPPRWNCDLGTIAYNCARMGLPGLGEGLALAMPMWERAGNKVYDYSGNQNHGVITTPNWQKNGLYFNGSNGIDIPDSSSLDINSNKITMFAICESTDYQNDKIIIEKGGWDTGTYQIVSGGDFWKFNIQTDPAEAHAPAMTYNRKYVIVGLYDSTHLYIYENGVDVTTSDEPTTANIGENSGDLTIGYRLGGSNYFTGWIYAACLWDTALTHSQIVTLSANPYGMFEPIRRVLWKVPAAGGLSIPVAMHHYRQQRL